MQKYVLESGIEKPIEGLNSLVKRSGLLATETWAKPLLNASQVLIVPYWLTTLLKRAILMTTFVNLLWKTFKLMQILLVFTHLITIAHTII